MTPQEYSDLVCHNAHTAMQMQVVTDAICCAHENLLRALENARGTGSPFEAVRELLATYTDAAKRIAADAVRIADECAEKASEYSCAVKGDEAFFAASTALNAQSAALAVQIRAEILNRTPATEGHKEQ